MGRVDLIHEELSFKIRGILYTVHNYLGPHRSEKQYCDAIERGLQVKGLTYEREKVLPICFVGERSGRNRLDFVVEDKIILEAKVVPTFSKNTYHQCLRYLAGSGKDLLLLINFFPESLFIKRILNPNLKNFTNHQHP